MSILFPISIAYAECSCIFLANSWSTRVSIFSCVLVFASLIGRFSTDEALRLGVICLVESSSEIGPGTLNFSFLRVGSCVGKNQMCCLCGWLFTQTDNVLNKYNCWYFRNGTPAPVAHSRPKWRAMCSRSVFLILANRCARRCDGGSCLRPPVVRAQVGVPVLIGCRPRGIRCRGTPVSDQRELKGSLYFIIEP